MMSDCCCELRDRWRDGETLDISQEMNWLTMVIVTKTLFGAEMDSAEVNVIRESLNGILDLFERSTLPPDEMELFNQLRARLDATVYRIIQERHASGDIDRGDLLSMLLLAHDEESDGSGMTDLQIHDEAMTIFLAGHETTANALTWAWYLLSQHPEVEARMHEELDRVLGGILPQMEDVARLPFVEKIFSEAMRLYPPVWVVGRRALRDIEIGGYKIAKGAIVLASQYVTHHDARYFPEPFRFDPERWNPDAVALRPKFSYFPFSAGSRQCLGEAFAWMESVLAIAILAQRWRLGLAHGHRAEAPGAVDAATEERDADAGRAAPAVTRRSARFVLDRMHSSRRSQDGLSSRACRGLSRTMPAQGMHAVMRGFDGLTMTDLVDSV